MEEEILRKATEVYMKYGIRSVTMDDIARELGISKKTIYQYFKDKDDLVERAVSNYIKSQENKIDMCCNGEGMNAIDQLLEISKSLISHHSRINHSMIYDLQKYHPRAWDLIINFRKEHAYTNIYNNLLLGIQEELYCKEQKADIIAHLYVSKMEIAFNELMNETRQYSFEEVFNSLFIYHIRGVSNARGLKYLDKKINNEHLY